MYIPPLEQRKAHYQSPYWHNLRAKARTRAGNQCEREIPVGDDPKGGDRTERCETTAGLQLHHLHYDTFGKELSMTFCWCAMTVTKCLK